MSTFSTIFSGTAPQTNLQAKGFVFVIRCVPDIFTGEMINIGVCAIDGAAGTRHVKVISAPGRLNCLYGGDADLVVNLAQAAKEAAERSLTPPSSQLIFDQPTPYYTGSAEEIMNQTFADQVTVALPHREGATVAPMDDQQAVEQVANAIKLLRGLDFNILANTPQVIIQTDKGPRTMHVPLQPADGVGTIRSAYFSAQTVKSHLMDSILDLDCASRYRKKKHLGLFVLRPAGGTKQAAIDNVIDDIAYRAPRNLHLEVSSDTAELARACAAWADAAA